MTKENKDVKRSFRFSQRTEDIIAQFEEKNMQQQFENLVQSVESKAKLQAELSALKQKIETAKQELTQIQTIAAAQKRIAEEMNQVATMVKIYKESFKKLKSKGA